jgi:hypothetical protein
LRRSVSTAFARICSDSRMLAAGRDHRLHDVQLQRPLLGRQRDRQVVADCGNLSLLARSPRRHGTRGQSTRRCCGVELCAESHPSARTPVSPMYPGRTPGSDPEMTPPPPSTGCRSYLQPDPTSIQCHGHGPCPPGPDSPFRVVQRGLTSATQQAI